MATSEPDGIAQSQLDALQALLAKLAQGNAFYGAKLKEGGLENGVTSLAQFSRNMPWTTKPELIADQEANPPYGTNLTYPIEGYTRFHQTSGSTGKPLRWLDTPASWMTLVDNWVRVFRAAGVAAADRCFFAFSFGPFLGFWTAFEAASKLGCLCIPGGGMRSLGRLQAILDNQVTVLCCTPTYAIHLGQVARAEGLDMGRSNLKRILVAGEPGGSIPAVRDTIHDLFPGARVYDHHGMTEIGPASMPCPDRPDVLHLIEPGFFAEVIDPEAEKPVAGGEPGELVITNLERDGMPLLRYRTGDLVKIESGPCRCGRHQSRLLGGILGRLDDMVIVRGVNLYPAAFDEIVRQVDGIVEYRVLIEESKGLNGLRVEIEARQQGEAESLAKVLSDQLHARFNLRIHVASVPAESLPRFELKAKRWQRIEPAAR